jgi:hypothetical protein
MNQLFISELVYRGLISGTSVRKGHGASMLPSLPRPNGGLTLTEWSIEKHLTLQCRVAEFPHQRETVDAQPGPSDLLGSL